MGNRTIPRKNNISKEEYEHKEKLFFDFIKCFGFDRMAHCDRVGSFERLLHGKRSYNHVANLYWYPKGWKDLEEVPDHNHGLLFKIKGSRRLVYVNQPYQFDKDKLETWCNERNLIYVICDKKYSFYYPKNTEFILIMSNDTYVVFSEIFKDFPRKWEH